MKLSFTSANNFKTCKKKFFHTYVARDVSFDFTPAMEHGIRVHKAFEDRLKKGHSFAGEFSHYEPFVRALFDAKNEDMLMLIEQRLAVRADGTPCGSFDTDCFWNGRVDVALCGDKACVIFDWKTGKEREDPWELQVQAVLVYAAYPHLKVFKGHYVWLKNDAVGESHDLSDLHLTWTEMKALHQMVQRSLDTNYFPEQEGPLCKFCPVYQCQFNKTEKPSVAPVVVK